MWGPRQQRGLLPRPASLYGLDHSPSGQSLVLIAPTLKNHNSGSSLTRTMFPTATASEVRRPGKAEPNPLAGHVSWFLSMTLIRKITGLQGSERRPVPSLASFSGGNVTPAGRRRLAPNLPLSDAAVHRSRVSRAVTPRSRGRGLHGLQSACADRPGGARGARRGRRPRLWRWMAAGRGRPSEGSLGIRGASASQADKPLGRKGGVGLGRRGAAGLHSS